MAEADRTDEELVALWDSIIDPVERDRLIVAMKERNLFPSEHIWAWQTDWENTTGAYPDIRDPEFLQKLMARREFADSYQSGWKRDINPCNTEEFEVSPVQRFVANFMSPKTPYRSALLFHGTGVGKTCSAIQISEQWLSMYPNKKVIILAPPTIQDGFRRTIFDADRVTFGAEEGEPNSASQCTGSTYLELTNSLFLKPDDPMNPILVAATRKRIANKVVNAIGRRYAIYGYQQFANVLTNLLKAIPERLQKALLSDAEKAELLQRKRRLYNEHYAGRLIIIDEAHNLRDIPEADSDKDIDTPGGDAELSDAAAGKMLTPLIRELLELADDVKLVMMTATPMYNSYREIIFLLNLILNNEKQATIRESDIFMANGQIRRPEGETKLAALAHTFISYMRGENPQIFPLRLNPTGTPKVNPLPAMSPRSVPIADNGHLTHLPIVAVPLVGDSLEAQRTLMDALPAGEGGISPFNLEPIVQAGTCIVPAVGEADIKARSQKTALSLIFHQQSVGGEMVWKAKKAGGAAWLERDALRPYAPKIAAVLDRIRTAEGICFVYSRFVSMGAVPIALALEANGYTPYERRLGYLGDGPQSPGGRQCALCPEREANHAGADHTFTPAKYVLLTGDQQISPKRIQHIQAAKDAANKEGALIKVIVGSQVASEGVDLKFVREIHILESWYHLNKTEQVVGRGIRTCSHMLLPAAKRNCTVYLYAGVMPADDGRETADLYSYRVAYNKGRLVGAVTRVLKINAVDCNLNHDAIVIRGEPPVSQVDSQRTLRRLVNINDKPFTALCDWMENCDYTCKPKIDMSEEAQVTASEISYDEYTGRWKDAELKKRLRALFKEQAAYYAEDLNILFSDIPEVARASLLQAIIGNPTFVVTNGKREGYIIKRNDYYLFQPLTIKDLRIPIAVRAANIPVRQDSYSPEFFEAMAEQMGPSAAASAAAAAAPAVAASSATLAEVLVAWAGWAEALGTATTPVPPSIIAWTAQDPSEAGKREERRRMLVWFAQSLRATEASGRLGPEKQASLTKIMMEYLFDEEFSDTDRMQIYSDRALRPQGYAIASEQFLREGRTEIFVHVDITNGKLVFMCEGVACKKSVAELFEGKVSEESEEAKRARNPAYGLKVNTTTAGSPYGFIVAKRGMEYVFKTNSPPPVGGKVTKGQECANVSTISDHRIKVIMLGKILGDTTGHNLDLTSHKLIEERKVGNSTQMCTLMDIVLRYMDTLKVNGKKWFYRPIASVMTGHLGTFRVKP
jgi:hypothetical protein